jgi:4-aminobutyrate aminotransferase-like enzyme
MQAPLVAVVYEAFKQGLLMLGAGESTLRLIPPLVIKKSELLIGIDIIESALQKVFRIK